MKKKLKIAVEVIALSEPVLTGIGNVVFNLIEQISKLDKENSYYFYSYHKINFGKIPEAENFTYKELFLIEYFDKLDNLKKKSDSKVFKLMISAIKKVLIYFEKNFLKIYLPFSIHKNKIDIFLGTSAHYFPKFLYSHPVKMAMVYDIVWKYFPETMQFKSRIVMQIFAKKNLKKVDQLFAISHSTKRSVQRDLKINTPIEVVHLAASKKVFFRAGEKKIQEVKKKHHIPGKYILSVSTLEPRKNLISLLEAFSGIKNKEGHKLVLVGRIGWKKTHFFYQFNRLNIKNDIILTGFVNNEDLAPLYSGATAFVYPTLYEGFGLPVLEAMQCGCPVIVSKCSAIPEVVGDAGIYISPKNIDEIKETIETVISNYGLRKTYGKKGLERAEMFSWEHSSKKILNILQNHPSKSGIR